MNAGPELDSLIGEQIMDEKGPKWVYYSTHLPYAWIIVEKLKSLRLAEFQLSYRDKYFYCNFIKDDNYSAEYAETAPHAICLAALKFIVYYKGFSQYWEKK